MHELKPHEQVAHQFMSHKGYPHIQPSDVEKLEGQPCWYFLFQLPEGTLELEVSWDGEVWSTLVTTFQLAG